MSVLGTNAGASCHHRPWFSPWEHPVRRPSSFQKSLCFAFPSSPCSRSSSRPGRCHNMVGGGGGGNLKIAVELFGAPWQFLYRYGMSSNDPLIRMGFWSIVRVRIPCLFSATGHPPPRKYSIILGDIYLVPDTRIYLGAMAQKRPGGAYRIWITDSGYGLSIRFSFSDSPIML